MDEEILAELLAGLVQPQQQQESNPLVQFLMDVAALPGPEMDVDERGEQLRGPISQTGFDPRRAGSAPSGPMFSDTGQGALEGLAQLLSAGDRPSGTALMDQPQDATRVARETFVNRLAEDSLVRDFSLREGIRSAGGIARQAVTGMPGMLVEILQDLQRDPLAFTPIVDVARGNEAAREGNLGEAGLFTALAATGLGGFLRKALGRRAGREVAEEGGSGIANLQREMRERRSGQAGRRGAAREGPTGRRASDVESEELFRGAESAVARDILNEARTRAAQGSEAVDPVTELIRLLEGS